MNETIILKKYDEVYLKFEADPGQQMELREFFSCHIKNYRYHPKVKAKIWDGRITYIDMIKKLIPIGMLELFIEFCDEYGYEFEFNFPPEDLYSNITKEELTLYLNDLFKNSKKKPREFQIEAIFKALSEKRGLLLSATGTGKSQIIYSLIKLWTDLDKKTLLIVPNTDLVEQMYDDFEEYGWDNHNEYVEILYSGKKPSFEKPVLISTWQSIPIKKKDSEFYQKFDCVIIDETHLAAALSIQNIMKQCINAEYRIGTTATLPDEKSDLWNIYSVLGFPIFEYTTKEGIDDGILSEMEIISILMKYPKQFIESNKDRNYNMEIDEIEEYEDRNRVILNCINRTKITDNIVLLCRHHKHLNSLKKYLDENCDRIIIENHGKIKNKIRKENRLAISEMEGVIILATYDTMSTGININKLHHIMFGSPYKAPTKVLQAIGRGLRLHETKDYLIVWDFVDDMRRIKRTGSIALNHCWKHYEERLSSYDKEGHTVYEEIIELNT